MFDSIINLLSITTNVLQNLAVIILCMYITKSLVNNPTNNPPNNPINNPPNNLLGNIHIQDTCKDNKQLIPNNNIITPTKDPQNLSTYVIHKNVSNKNNSIDNKTKSPKKLKKLLTLQKMNNKEFPIVKFPKK